MSWNYRVVKRPERESDTGFIYHIHEAYYDNDDPNSIGVTENPVIPAGETIDELRKCLEMMINDIDRFRDEIIDSDQPEPFTGAFTEDILS